MANWPGIGRLVRIGVAVIRLPEFRATYDETQRQRQAGLTLLAPSAPDAPVSPAGARFEADQLPALLQAISDINHRQLSSVSGQENLVRSAPVALRKLTRETVELRGQDRVRAEQLEALAQRIGQVEALAQRAGQAGAQQAGQAEAQRAGQAAAQAQWAGQLETLVQRIAQLEAQAQRAGEVEALAQRVEQLGTEVRDAAARAGNAENGLGGLAESVSYLLGRVEFVRREVMFEMRYGATAATGDKEAIEPTIVATDKVEAARGTGLRLNLGCGHVALDGYINVDRRALPGVDVVADIDRLPFGKGEVAEICSAHMLEHFPLEQLRRELLPYWISLLGPEGRFRATVPDGAAMARAFVAQEYDFENFRQVTFGGQDYDGDFHFNMFSTESMTALLTEAGFRKVEVVAENRENGGCKEFEIVAYL